MHCAGQVSCSGSDDTPTGPDTTPNVSITPGRAGATTIHFTLTPTHAQKVAYLVIRSDGEFPDAETVLAIGENADASQPGEYEQTGLETGTAYTVLAAAAAGNKISEVSSIEMIPVILPTASVTAGNRTGTMITFEIRVADAEHVAYWIAEAGEPVPDAATILADGKHANTASVQTYTGYGLRLDTEYTVAVAASSATGMSDPEQIRMRTDDHYYVGDLYRSNGVEGIVFVTSVDGLSGKVVSFEETRLAWSTQMTNTDALDWDDGRANMQIIKAIPDWEQKYPAFAWCDAMNTEGQPGWYFPALNEVGILYINHNGGKGPLNSVQARFFNACLTNNGGKPLTADIYWSSTQWAEGFPFGYAFAKGAGAIGIENTAPHCIRAVCNF